MRERAQITVYFKLSFTPFLLLSRDDVFLDLGSGAGSLLLMACHDAMLLALANQTKWHKSGEE